MADEQYTFAQARARLEDIVAQVRKKDTSLEKSLDLLEEGVRLANVCTELSDHTEWRSVIDEQGSTDEDGESVGEGAGEDGTAVGANGDGIEPGGAKDSDDRAAKDTGEEGATGDETVPGA